MTRISPERKTAYYVGNGIALLGLLLFLSVFVTTALNFGNFDNFDGQARSAGLRAISGILLIIIGSVIHNVGARGLAGSGVMLDPEKAREDLKPYSHMTGGMISDTLDKANLGDHFGVGSQPERVVMLKCSQCRFLNEEDSKFCQECGSEI